MFHSRPGFKSGRLLHNQFVFSPAGRIRTCQLMGSACGPGCESRLRTVLEIRPAGGRPEPPGVGLGRALPLYGCAGMKGVYGWGQY